MERRDARWETWANARDGTKVTDCTGRRIEGFVLGKAPWPFPERRDDGDEDDKAYVDAMNKMQDKSWTWGDLRYEFHVAEGV